MERVASLLGILKTTPSPVARVDHGTGDSFVNNIEPSDDQETVVEKVAVWYCNMEPDADQVYTNLYVGNGKSVKTLSYLKSLGITHVVNAAEGDWVASVTVDRDAYKENGLEYFGMLCNDMDTVDISVFFKDTADFIDQAIQGGGQVLVNCFAGVSRSCTIAVSYLMQKKGMSVEEAMVAVKKNRDVHPNEGFLAKLVKLDEELQEKRTK
eukprot:GFUD01104518.1.p1 GENE.GFUD01104518.1~~GFUD01104518.1.p1  ORF type:complete len:210 (-),score=65.12 GFUD01104518.1:79-708(-)